MTDQPQQVTAPPAEGQVVRTVRVMLKTGGWVDVATVNDFGMFCTLMVRDRAIIAPGLWIPMSNIAYMQQTGQGTLGEATNVVQMKP